MIDLHSHILPGIDDGCKDEEEAIEVLKTMRKNGTEVLALTPHFRYGKDSVEFFIHKRGEVYDNLLRAIEESGAEVPKLVLGAEVRYFDSIADAHMLEALCYEKSRFILIEMPFAKWSRDMLVELNNITVRKGIVPVVAHVNRYLKYGNKLDDIADLRIPMQINAEVFESFFSKRKWLKVVEKYKSVVLGSDCHNSTTRAPNLHIAEAEVMRSCERRTIHYIKKTEKLILGLAN